MAKKTSITKEMETELITLFQRQTELSSNLSLYADVGDREGWENSRAELYRVEDEIFNLAGVRPPYARGWGGLFGSMDDD